MFSRRPESRVSALVAPDALAREHAGPPPPVPSAVPAPVNSRQGDQPAESQSIIGRDLSIEGDAITIRCQGSLRVNGNIQADLHSRQIVVGEEGVINGSIAAHDVAVYGRVNGAIYGAQVTLHASSKVDGDIHSRDLAVERGATFEGRSRRVADVAEIAPKLVATGEPAAPAQAAGRIQT